MTVVTKAQTAITNTDAAATGDPRMGMPLPRLVGPAIPVVDPETGSAQAPSRPLAPAPSQAYPTQKSAALMPPTRKDPRQGVTTRYCEQTQPCGPGGGLERRGPPKKPKTVAKTRHRPCMSVDFLTRPPSIRTIAPPNLVIRARSSVG